jgi:TRAP-type mannitol/chloroaromatic compound transport system permease small subunit
MGKLEDTLSAVNIAVGSVVRWFALVMALIQFAIVLLRYVFGFSDIALNESVLYLHAFLFMLGAGYTLLVDGHVRVDIFYARLSDKAKSRIDLFGHVFFLMPAMLTVLYWSWPSIRNSWSILEGPISVGGIPASFLLKSLIPAFCVLLLIQSLACIMRDIARLRG